MEYYDAKQMGCLKPTGLKTNIFSVLSEVALDCSLGGSGAYLFLCHGSIEIALGIQSTLRNKLNIFERITIKFHYLSLFYLRTLVFIPVSQCPLNA